MTPIKSLQLFLSVTLLAALVTTSGASFSVGIIHSEGEEGPQLVADALLKYGAGIIDHVNFTASDTDTPSVEWMNEFDVLLVFANNDIANQTLFGDRLAEYIDNGRGVVTATYTIASCCFGTVPLGEFAEKYQAIAVNDTCYGKNNGEVFAEVQLPDHALAQGWSNFTDSNTDRPTCQALAEGAYVVASWSDGLYLAVARDNLGPAKVSRVDLGFYPSDHTENEEAMKLLVASLAYVYDSEPSSASALSSWAAFLLF